jgi:hypothetical protein
VTLAVLCTSTGSALDPADATRLAGELGEALTAAGADRVERLPSGMGQLAEIARIAHTAGEPVLICADNLVAHKSLLWMLATEPGGRTSALVVPDDRGDVHVDRGRVRRGRDARFAGALFVARADLPLLAATADRLAAQVRTPEGILATDVRTALDLLLSTLLEAGAAPVATRPGGLHAARVITPAQLAAARAAVAAVDEESVRLRLAVTDEDDFVATYAVGSWSPRVVRRLARLRLTPAAVAGSLAAAVAALCFAQASRLAMIGGALLACVSFALRCMDGQLARFTRRPASGRRLDVMAGYATEYVVYAGLAAGADHLGLPYAWPLAIAAMVVQSVRHTTDAWYGVWQDAAPPRPPRTGRPGALAGRLAGEPESVAYWLRRVVAFPAGARWAVIALVALVFDGRVALATLLLGQLAAFGWTSALRVARAVTARTPVPDPADLIRRRDDGYLVRAYVSRAGGPLPLVAALVAVVAALGALIALLTGALPHATWTEGAPVLTGVTVLVLVAGVSAGAGHTRPLDWLVPVALRAAEYLTVCAAGVVGAVPPPLVFLVIVLLAMWHTARDPFAYAGPMAARRAVRTDWAGWDGRVVFLWLTTLLTVSAGGMALLGAVVAADLAYGLIRPKKVAGRGQSPAGRSAPERA